MVNYVFFITLKRSYLDEIHNFRFLYIYFSGYWWLVTSGPLYSSACYLLLFVCFYDLLNNGVFRKFPNSLRAHGRKDQPIR